MGMAAPPHTLPLQLATAAALPGLARLYARCARGLGPQVYQAAQVQAWASFADDTAAFARYVLSARTWVAEGADGPLGFCGIDAAGEVHSLYVHPAHMRAGLATRLLAHAMADARATAGVARFQAWATPFSRAVFERAGFRLQAVVREPFGGVLFDRLRLAT